MNGKKYNNSDEFGKTENEEENEEEIPHDNSENKEKSDILERTGKEYFNSGEEEFLKERYNSSVVLYFKALTSFVDLFLLKETGESPSSHTDRFRKTKENFPEVYDILDKDFPFYQSSYISLMSKELAEVIKDDAKTMAEKSEVKL